MALAGRSPEPEPRHDPPARGRHAGQTFAVGTGLAGAHVRALRPTSRQLGRARPAA